MVIENAKILCYNTTIKGRKIMNKDDLSIAKLNINVDTFNALRRILKSKHMPLTVGGIKELGIEGIYDFDVVPEYFGAKKMNGLLNSFAEIGEKLKIEENVFDNLDFDCFEHGAKAKKSVKDVLEYQGALVYAKDQTVLLETSREK